jgi:hypothetical protein
MTSASRTSAAARQRRSRAKRRSGLRSYRLFLPEQELLEAVCVRENLAPGTMPTARQIETALDAAYRVWLQAWIKVGASKR